MVVHAERLHGRDQKAGTERALPLRRPGTYGVSEKRERGVSNYENGAKRTECKLYTEVAPLRRGLIESSLSKVRKGRRELARAA